MKIKDVISEGKNDEPEIELPSYLGGGRIKLEVRFDSNGVLTKYAFAYINLKWCPQGRLWGVDSEHPGHQSDTPHIHACKGRKTPLKKDLTIDEAKRIFYSGLERIIMNHIIKETTEIDLSPGFLQKVPELQSFFTKADDLFRRAEEGRLKAVKMYSGKDLTVEDFNHNVELYEIWQECRDYRLACKKYQTIVESRRNL